MKSLQESPRRLRKEINGALVRMGTNNVSIYLPMIKDEKLKGLSRTFKITREAFGYIRFEKKENHPKIDNGL